MSSQSNMENIHKKYDERYRIDNDDHKKSDEKYHIVERQLDEIDLEESETDERDQI